MNEEGTTAAVQRYLDQMAGDAPAEPVLTRPPLNLQADELLGAVVERLLKALREARPATVRQFFALASQHMRWELNGLARRLDEQPAALQLCEGLVAAPARSDSGLLPAGRRILEAIEGLPEGEREAFDLVKIQGLRHAEAAEVLGVSLRTVKRWVSRGLRLLTTQLADLGPERDKEG
jgi:RNA polymerase sigma-70 factor (ECF subfamily)